MILVVCDPSHPLQRSGLYKISPQVRRAALVFFIEILVQQHEVKPSIKELLFDCTDRFLSRVIVQQQQYFFSPSFLSFLQDSLLPLSRIAVFFYDFWFVVCCRIEAIAFLFWLASSRIGAASCFRRRMHGGAHLG